MSKFTPPEFPDNSFVKASGSGTTGCVSVSIQPGGVGVRDSKEHSGPVLAFTEHEWDVFVASVKAGEFDRH